MKKYNSLIKCIGNTYLVIEDLSKFDFYYAKVLEVIDDYNVKMRDEQNNVKNVSIFNLRNPRQDI
jgi:hypothetical protein